MALTWNHKKTIFERRKILLIIIDFIENLPYNTSDYFIDNSLQKAIRNSPYYYNKEEDIGHE